MDGLPSSYLSARIARRQNHTDDLATFWLRPERPVAFQPGQYVTLALTGASGRLVKRPYSVLSAPHEIDLELFVERVEGGELTPKLFSAARATRSGSAAAPRAPSRRMPRARITSWRAP